MFVARKALCWRYSQHFLDIRERFDALSVDAVWNDWLPQIFDVYGCEASPLSIFHIWVAPLLVLMSWSAAFLLTCYLRLSKCLPAQGRPVVYPRSHTETGNPLVFYIRERLCFQIVSGRFPSEDKVTAE
ncbi:hypothetical protein BDR06DRAFT_959431 [Suillus hirtellus]|nr:hypothetical protein BDR06DRAFT_959431 [Suillus hirtellus]